VRACPLSPAPELEDQMFPLRPRGTFSVTLQTAGTFPCYCSIHPGMVGRVTVR
jgi:plastocyanin